MKARLTRDAFTLIELLIVVAIISILASIAVPNFLEAQTRAKVARVHNDLRVVTIALEAYHVDNNTYPSRTKEPAAPDVAGIGDIELRMEEMARMTTPIAYITSLPTDIFVPPSAGVPSGADKEFTADDIRSFDYWDDDQVASVVVESEGGPVSPTRTWALVSLGPDLNMGLGGFWGNIDPPENSDPAFASYRHDYDATNGTISPGNIYRFRAAASAEAVFSKDSSPD